MSPPSSGSQGGATISEVAPPAFPKEPPAIFKIGDRVWFHNTLQGLVVFAFKNYLRLCIRSKDKQILYIDADISEVKLR